MLTIAVNFIYSCPAGHPQLRSKISFRCDLGATENKIELLLRDKKWSSIIPVFQMFGSWKLLFYVFHGKDVRYVDFDD